MLYIIVLRKDKSDIIVLLERDNVHTYVLTCIRCEIHKERSYLRINILQFLRFQFTEQ